MLETTAPATGLERLASAFERAQDARRPLLNVYTTAGYPRIESTGVVLRTLSEAGVDFIELGMPYSDPLADGETIQLSSARALANGLTLDRLFAQVAEVRADVRPPIILMGYVNQVLQYGRDRFLERCVEVGVDGLILPDLPLEAYERKYRAAIEAAGMGISFLVTPRTPPERVRRVDALCRGFLYVVSSSSTTGSSVAGIDGARDYLARLAAMDLRSPRLVGFNIRDAASLAATVPHARGGIIGSAFIRALDEDDVAGSARRFVAGLRD